MPNRPQAVTSHFAQLGIFPPLLKVLEQLRFTVPTPIQHQSIPAGIEGKDIIGIAQTGTGKTLAFGVPMVQRLYAAKGRGLVLVPTRELALQVDETFRKIGRSLGIHTAVLIGGESMRPQLDALRRTPRIIVATPGRLIDHLQQGTVRLSDVKILVLDEADRMLDMGFAPQINQILKTVPRDRQTMLYSATMPQTIARIAASYMALPVRVEIAPSGTTIEQVEQEIVVVRKESKHDLLESILNGCNGRVLVFSRTKHGAKKICRDLQRTGHPAAEIHSNRSLAQHWTVLGPANSGSLSPPTSPRAGSMSATLPWSLTMISQMTRKITYTGLGGRDGPVARAGRSRLPHPISEAPFAISRG
ncbi:MAG: DEAD/DEAH box helicase [Deltaproteobacteria bacterium]|nr:DEAD/DEAH box helicase [Deltaproteobacteria bacterium]